MTGDARVVIVGGGVAGVSTLYHLTRLGWNDVVLVEAAELTSGSTWHAAGLCTQFVQSVNLMTLLRSSVELYGRLESETGLPVDFHGCGSVRIGTTADRLLFAPRTNEYKSLPPTGCGSANNSPYSKPHRPPWTML